MQKAVITTLKVSFRDSLDFPVVVTKCFFAPCAAQTKYPKWKDEPVAEVDTAIAALKTLIAEQKAEEKKKAAAAPKTVAVAASASSATSSGATGAGGAGDKHLLSVLFSKKDAFSEWYSDVIFKSELISNYPISGCYV